MPAKGSYCEMCSHRGKKADMVVENGRYFCSRECSDWYSETYLQKEVNPIGETMEHKK